MNPYKSIWLNPRVTFEELASREKQPLLILPIIGNGLIFGLDAYPDIASIFDEGEGFGLSFLHCL